MPVPPPVKRTANIQPPLDRVVIRDDEYDPGMDEEIFDAPMPMSSDMWDDPIPPANYYNDYPVGNAVATISESPVSNRAVYVPDENPQPLPDPRRRVARVSGGLTAPVMPQVNNRFSLTPATAAALGATALFGGMGLHALMNRREEQQPQQVMVQAMPMGRY